MHHGLLVANQPVPQSRLLLERLPDPGYVPMSEDSQTRLEEPVLLALALAVLVLQEGDHGLRHGQSSFHGQTPRRVKMAACGPDARSSSHEGQARIGFLPGVAN